MVVDALGRTLRLGRPAGRIVSLVPSETESVVALGGLERLVGRTTWCEEPVGSIETVPAVGGTKDPDVARILDLRPDLVLANQEENSRKAVERLIEAGLPVHVSFPQSVRGAVEYLSSLLTLLGADLGAKRMVQELEERVAQAEADTAGRRAKRVFVPIWREPWMTIDGRTFGHDILRLSGLDNVFASRVRRYPLRADLGTALSVDPGERDTRYPRVTLDEVEQAEPELILLPDEPYRFGPEHVEEAYTWDCPASEHRAVALTSGKDLFWYGVRMAEAIDRLSTLAA